MANLKSSKKDIRRTVVRTARNRATLSSVRTFYKNALLAIKNNLPNVSSAIQIFEKKAMKAAQKNVILKLTASRKVSNLVQKAKKLSLLS